MKLTNVLWKTKIKRTPKEVYLSLPFKNNDVIRQITENLSNLSRRIDNNGNGASCTKSIQNSARGVIVLLDWPVSSGAGSLRIWYGTPQMIGKTVKPLYGVLRASLICIWMIHDGRITEQIKSLIFTRYKRIVCVVAKLHSLMIRWEVIEWVLCLVTMRSRAKILWFTRQYSLQHKNVLNEWILLHSISRTNVPVMHQHTQRVFWQTEFFTIQHQAFIIT